MWGKMGHPAKTTKFSAKSSLSLLMGLNKSDKAHFPHFHLFPSFFIDFDIKDHDLMSNRHLHKILFITQQFLPSDNFFLAQLTYQIILLLLTR